MVQYGIKFHVQHLTVKNQEPRPQQKKEDKKFLDNIKTEKRSELKEQTVQKKNEFFCDC